VVNMRQVLIGKPLATDQAIHQRLSKLKALAVFSSDALSSSAYATEAILLVLVAAGTGALTHSWPIALAISTLLFIVSFSYYQTIHAYPNGGGAYIVSKDNLGTMPGLVAAASLLIDYTLTVAVSISAGVAAITSAFPELAPDRVPIALVIVTFITIMNLRGVKESGTFFSIPTYAFVIGMLTMIGMGVLRVATGGISTDALHEVEVIGHTTDVLHGLTLFLILRAFAAGCTALTGVEAISNGIPAFKPPESDNAGKTLITMVVLLCTMFVGITFLANHFPIHELGGERTVISQMSEGVFGRDSIGFYYLQLATLLILSLAANTAFADFPRLASLISRDRYLPRQLTNLGDRLVFSNGIVLLMLMASLLIVLFGAREHNLLPLYAVGVFVSFTLSQSGMVIHWLRERAKPEFKTTRSWYMKIILNGFGAVSTFIVMLILMVTKFVEGAWIVILAIPTLMFVFTRIHKHYLSVAASLTLDGIHVETICRHRENRNNTPMVVLMNSLNRSSLQALEYALHSSADVRVCAIEVEPEATERLHERWKEWKLKDIPLDVVTSPYREIGYPLTRYLHKRDQANSTGEPTIVILPEFVVSHWWERLLHNQTSVAIRDALYRDQLAGGRGRPVISVPYRIGDELYEPMALQNQSVAAAVQEPVEGTVESS
jgi:amino acid transporter